MLIKNCLNYSVLTTSYVELLRSLEKIIEIVVYKIAKVRKNVSNIDQVNIVKKEKEIIIYSRNFRWLKWSLSV